MHTGELLTRGTVWLALSLYVAAEAMKAPRYGNGSRAAARWMNTLGCIVFLAHVACAFHFYHAWSHREAYEHTASQTAEWLGWNWGGGLFLNYAFGVLWLSDAAWSWCGLMRHRQRARWVIWTVRGFFFFMIFNGAVLFAHGLGRWFGGFLCLALAASWWPGRKAEANSLADE